jgi:ribosome biogenesis GTPase
MELTELGWDRWFQEQAGRPCSPDQRIARVTAVDRGRYVVRNEQGEVPARATGRLLYSAGSNADLPCVGDWVCVRYSDPGDLASIHCVLPRRSLLRRKTAGKDVDSQAIAANVDVAFIVQSCHFDFNVARLERYLVMASESRVEPLLILTKTDLVSPDELEGLVARIRRAGIDAGIIALSNVTGDGMDRFREAIVAGRTYCLLGSSGVGKTTLINQLIGSPVLETGTVSGTGEGRHITSRRQLIVLDQGALLIDTPGMRELGILGAGEGVDDSFADIRELSQSCRFTDCSHTNEPGCAVLMELENGELNQEHYRNYLKLKKESEFHELSYVEKRKKDRAFGRFIKSSMKHRDKYG